MRHRPTAVVAAALALVALANSAKADLFNVTAGGPLPDVQTREFFFAVSGMGGTITDVDVRISISHTFDADLDVFLISPAGTMVELTTDNGGSGDNFQDTMFDDQAATNVTAGIAPFASAPWPGGVSYRPEIPTNVLFGQFPNGTWTLRVTDDANGGSGQLYRAGDAAPWGTAVGTQLILTVPGPGATALLAIATIAARRKSRN